MLTIPIKIAKEDKAIMVRLLENARTDAFDFSDLDKITIYEIYIELLSKFRASLQEDKTIMKKVVKQ